MRRFKIWDYIPFSRSERRSILLTIIFISGVLLLSRFYFKYVKEYEVIIIPSMDSLGISVSDDSHTTSDSYIKEKKHFCIDINHADTIELKRLPGIGSAYSKRIVNYRRSIGGFDHIEDIKKVYGLEEELFQRIEEHLVITPFTKVKPADISPKTPKNKERYKQSEKPIEMVKVDINTADSATFCLLKGIGPVLAGRTVNYRISIRGFDSLSQLKNVYGINEDLYESLLAHLTISSYAHMQPHSPKSNAADSINEQQNKVIATLDLNSSTAEELQALKGIGPFFSSQIVKQREVLNGYAQMDQLLKIPKMNEETYRILIENADIISVHRPFALDTISFSNLLKMKILEYEEVKYVFNLKRSRGRIETMQELRNLQGIPSEKLDLLEKYIVF